jgi:hypothetical protein
VAVEDHPLFRTWSEALDRLVEAERRYHRARMEGQSEDELQPAARDLDDARESYRIITERVEEYDPEKPQGGEEAQGASDDPDDTEA